MNTLEFFRNTPLIVILAKCFVSIVKVKPKELSSHTKSPQTLAVACQRKPPLLGTRVNLTPVHSSRQNLQAERTRHLGQDRDPGRRHHRPDDGLHPVRQSDHLGHAGAAQEGRIDEQDVGHRQEGGDAGQDLGLDRGAVFVQLEGSV